MVEAIDRLLGSGENWLLLATAVVYALALMSAIRAIMVTRTAQGALGWVIALLALPIVTLPLYWVFGRTRFEGYTSRRAMVTARARQEFKPLERLRDFEDTPQPALHGLHFLACKLSDTGFLGGNRIGLLVGGPATFDAILTAIAAARRRTQINEQDLIVCRVDDLFECGLQLQQIDRIQLALEDRVLEMIAPVSHRFEDFTQSLIIANVISHQIDLPHG